MDLHLEPLKLAQYANLVLGPLIVASMPQRQIKMLFIYLLTYLFTYLLTYLLTYIFIYFVFYWGDIDNNTNSLSIFHHNLWNLDLS